MKSFTAGWFWLALFALVAVRTSSGQVLDPDAVAVGHPGFMSPHASPIVLLGDKVLVVNTPADTVDVIDSASRVVVSRINVGVDPVGIAARPDGKEVWASDVNHELVFVFDVTQNPPKQIARFENPGDPYWLTVTPDGKTVYVASATDDTVTAYDVAAKKKRAVIQLPKGKAPKLKKQEVILLTIHK